MRASRTERGRKIETGVRKEGREKVRLRRNERYQQVVAGMGSGWEERATARARDTDKETERGRVRARETDKETERGRTRGGASRIVLQILIFDVVSAPNL